MTYILCRLCFQAVQNAVTLDSQIEWIYKMSAKQLQQQQQQQQQQPSQPRQPQPQSQQVSAGIQELWSKSVCV